MSEAQLKEELRHKDTVIAEQAERIADLEQRVAELQGQLQEHAAAKKAKKPSFSGDYSLGTQERKRTRQRKKRSPGRRKKQEKLRRVARTEEVYPGGVPPERCCFVRERLAWRLEDGRAVLVGYRLHKEKWTGTVATVPELMPRGEYGIEIAVVLTFLVHCLGISIDKARALLAFFCKLELSPSQADSLLNQLAHLWRKEFETLCDAMALALVVYMDETGWKVSRENCYAWVFRSLSHTVLLYGRGRDGSVVEEMLPANVFSGVAVSDDYGVYRNRFSQAQKCWAHYLRKAIALMLAYPDRPEYREFFENLLALYRDGKRFQQDARLGEAGRSKRVASLEDRLWKLCHDGTEELTTEVSQDWREFINLQRALLRAMRDEELFTFVRIPEVEATNNVSERTFRMAAQQRQAGQTSKTGWGARRRSILQSVLLSLKQNLDSFTLQDVVAEVTGWCQTGISLFRRQLDALRKGDRPPCPAAAPPG